MILSSMNPEELRQAVLTENVSLIQSIKGIGPKSAKRLILELKDKMGHIPEGLQSEVMLATNSSATAYNTFKEEALTALTLLGFSRPASEKAISKVLKDNEVDSLESLIRLALKNV
jgi:Holliday junction DNA helicase RuvA